MLTINLTIIAVAWLQPGDHITRPPAYSRTAAGRRLIIITRQEPSDCG